MSSLSSVARKGEVKEQAGSGERTAERRGWVTLGFAGAMLLLIACPRVHGHTGVMWAFAAVGAGLAAWSGWVWLRARARGESLRIEYVAVKSHWVQAILQVIIVGYWGWFWRPVYENLPLIAGQLCFMYALEGLVTWSRGRTWRVGFGPMPIVISTNLLLWFRDEYFVFQFVMLGLGMMGKQFITWEREGRRAHIFNPSAFGQSVVAVGLIATGMTTEMTWGEEIARQFEVPHMLVVIFGLGLVVQLLFRVTLMTVAAASTLALVSVVYHWETGLYYFVNTNMAAPIFLGLHLLLTDPATSPRTRVGQVVFGVLYALGYSVLFRLFNEIGVPLFWDKLLPVPVLNLMVPVIDWWSRAGVVGKVNGVWERALRPGWMNLLHMGVWTGIFGLMVGTGFIEGRHPGNDIRLWKRAYMEGKPFAEHGYVLASGAQAEGTYRTDDPKVMADVRALRGAAYNELGYICVTDEEIGTMYAAATHFANAVALGSIHGAANMARMQLFDRVGRPGGQGAKDMEAALALLEGECVKEADWAICYLVGHAYETGIGRAKDARQAIGYYERCGTGNSMGAKGIARVVLSEEGVEYDLTLVRMVLDELIQRGDPEACWYVGYMFAQGKGVPRNEETARKYLERGCALGSAEACSAARSAAMPAFKRPMMERQAWASAYILDER